MIGFALQMKVHMQIKRCRLICYLNQWDTFE